MVKNKSYLELLALYLSDQSLFLFYGQLYLHHGQCPIGLTSLSRFMKHMMNQMALNWQSQFVGDSFDHLYPSSNY